MAAERKPTTRRPRAKKPVEPTPAQADAQAFEQVATEVLTKVAERVAPPEPTGAQLVARIDDPQDVFRVMDAYDEAQILDELEGRPSDKMVYSFSSGGKKQSGLSYSGVSESVRTLNARGLAQIRVAKDVVPQFREVVEQDGDKTMTYVEALVYGEDAKTGGGEWGIARQPKFQTYQDKDKAPTLDKFATTKALSKAQRNAQMELIPLAFREVLIALALKDNRRVQIVRQGVPSTAEAALPAPLQDERAVELVEEIRAAYDEAKKLPGGVRAMPPGRFNAKLTRARATDHKALEELRDEMKSLLAHLQGEGKAA